MSRLPVAIATVGGVGYSPVAPGTAGSAAGVFTYYILMLTGGAPAVAAALIVVCVAGVWSATAAERHFKSDDPGPVVIDEVAGMLATLAFMPLGWSGVAIGFLLFRLFDVVKPWPASCFERLPGGWGVMGDDVMAGIYANLVLRAIRWRAPDWTS